jgi:hypothetical protein
MKNVLVVFFGLVVSLIQVSLLANLSMGSGSVNLIILILLFLILLGYEDEALWWVAITGIILDIYSPVRFGFNIILLLVVWGVLRYLTRKYFLEFSLLTAGWMIILAILLFSLPWAIYFSSWWQIISVPLINLAIGLPTFFLISRFAAQIKR